MNKDEDFTPEVVIVMDMYVSEVGVKMHIPFKHVQQQYTRSFLGHHPRRGLMHLDRIASYLFISKN